MCHKIDTLYTEPFVFSLYPSNSAIIEYKRKCTSIVVLVLEFVDVQSCHNIMCINVFQTHKGTQFPLIPKQIAGVRGFSVCTGLSVTQLSSQKSIQWFVCQHRKQQC